MSDSNVMGSEHSGQDSNDEFSKAPAESGASETLDAGSGEGTTTGSRPRVQRQPKTDEPSVHEQVFENARKSAERGVASVRQAVSDAEPGSILLSTTMIAVGSAAVGALVGWYFARR